VSNVIVSENSIHGTFVWSWSVAFSGRSVPVSGAPQFDSAFGDVPASQK
jgi:hypothetical protein